VLPTAAGRLVLLDVGPPSTRTSTTLAMHARLGAAYAAVVHGVADPRSGLLTIGTERGKGDRLRRAAPAVLAALALPPAATPAWSRATTW
jgi:glycerol-3-phosphate acyltransferase PlsX